MKKILSTFFLENIQGHSLILIIQLIIIINK